MRWAYGQGARELHEALATLAGTAQPTRPQLDGAHAAYDAVSAFEAQADRTRSSIEATAQALLRAYRFARVARSARACEITADRLLDERATLYLIGDAKASKLLRPIFLALLSEVVDRAYERATLGRRQARAARCCCASTRPATSRRCRTSPRSPRRRRATTSSWSRSSTTSPRRASRYGQQAETVVNSHRARMLLPGVADLETLRYFAGLVGEEEARDQTRTTGAGRHQSRRRRGGAVRCVAPEALRQLPERHALLLYGRLRPAQIRLRMWFDDRRLRRLARSSMSWLEPEDGQWDDPYGDGWDGPRRQAVAARLARALPARAVDVVRAAVDRCVHAARALPAAACARAGGRTRSRSRRWPRWRVVASLRLGRVGRPAGKLALLYDLERVAALLRDGDEPFHPDRDRLAFARYLIDIGCQPPPDGRRHRNDMLQR